MADTEKIQQYIDLSRKYREAAEMLFDEGFKEPALFDALHSIELAVKALLYTIIEDDIYTHQVAGMFGRYFRKVVGKDFCRRIARTLAKYNTPRYPDPEEMDIEEVAVALELAEELLDEVVPDVTEGTIMEEE